MSTKPMVWKILSAGLAFLVIVLLGTCIAFANTDVTLVWDSNAESDMSYYKMYRSDDDGATWIQVGQILHIGAGEETFIDQNVPDGSYKWQVTAVDNDGLESGPSNVVGEILETQPPAPPINLWIKLKQIIACLINWLFGWA